MTSYRLDGDQITDGCPRCAASDCICHMVGCDLPGCEEGVTGGGRCRTHCRVLGCDGTRAYKSAMCRKHLSRWVDHGNVRPPKITTEDRASERFWLKVEVGGDDECWIYQGPVNRRGYGKFSIGSTYWAAHRFAYTDKGGTIPAGLTLDHLCRTPLCVNPAHLEPVTNEENVRRRWRSA